MTDALQSDDAVPRDGNVTYELLLEHLKDGVCYIDPAGKVTFWNQGAERITGYTREEVASSNGSVDTLQHTDESGNRRYERETPLQKAIVDGTTHEEELFLRHKSGHLVPVLTRVSPIKNSLGEIIGALEVFSDNTSKLHAHQRIQQLEAMALLCPLTGVGNRRYAVVSLENAFEEMRRYNWTFGLLFLDIDHFKAVNDTHGHAIGDEVLKEVANRLRSALRSFDFVGRWGGEEFLILLPNVDAKVLAKVAERCRDRVASQPIQTHRGPLEVTASIGGVMAHCEETPDACVERADRLMYTAKAQGRNRVVLPSDTENIEASA